MVTKHAVEGNLDPSAKRETIGGDTLYKETENIVMPPYYLENSYYAEKRMIGTGKAAGSLVDFDKDEFVPRENTDTSGNREYANKLLGLTDPQTQDPALEMSQHVRHKQSFNEYRVEHNHDNYPAYPPHQSISRSDHEPSYISPHRNEFHHNTNNNIHSLHNQYQHAVPAYPSQTHVVTHPRLPQEGKIKRFNTTSSPSIQIKNNNNNSCFDSNAKYAHPYNNIIHPPNQHQHIGQVRQPEYVAYNYHQEYAQCDPVGPVFYNYPNSSSTSQVYYTMPFQQTRTPSKSVSNKALKKNKSSGGNSHHSLPTPHNTAYNNGPFILPVRSPLMSPLMGSNYGGTAHTIEYLTVPVSSNFPIYPQSQPYTYNQHLPPHASTAIVHPDMIAVAFKQLSISSPSSPTMRNNINNINNSNNTFPSRANLQHLSGYSPDYQVVNSAISASKGATLVPYNALSEYRGQLVRQSMDMHGSRYIQDILTPALSKTDLLSIYGELIGSFARLSANVFGNYVVQKMIDLGDSQQQLLVFNELANDIVKLSYNVFGCRVIQKLISVIDHVHQQRILKELEKNVIDCIFDQNGNHVFQKCIECMPSVDLRKFITTSYVQHAYNIATHPYGCRVLQRILETQIDKHHFMIIFESLYPSFTDLFYHQYGNYVVQHLIQYSNNDTLDRTLELIKGNVFAMSLHKYASNIIEKCLIHGTIQHKHEILLEILPTTLRNPTVDKEWETNQTQVSFHGQTDVAGDKIATLNTTEIAFVQLMNDQYGNYVIQRLIETSFLLNREIILDAIVFYFPHINNSTYGKRLKEIATTILDNSISTKQHVMANTHNTVDSITPN